MQHTFFKMLQFLALALGFTACTKDFDEINVNPNSPTAVTPALLLPQIQREVMNSLMGETWGIGNIVIQHTAKNQFVNEDRYIWGDLTGIWNSVYDNMRDVNNILIQAEALNDPNYKGIALVMRAWMFSLVTDAYGDCPYSEATKAKQGINYTKYDNQEDIYNGILRDLQDANGLFTGGKIAGDIIYNGDTKLWQKLANSLRIRALMRISRKKDVGPELRTIFNDPTTYPIFTSVAEQANYSFKATSPDQFPLYSARIGSFNEFRASKTLLDTLQTLGDPRMMVYFRATPATENTPNEVYAGLPNGLADQEALQYNGGPQNQSRIGALYYENAVTTEGLNIAKGIIMSYAELQFLLAEAAEKDLITANAEDFYKNGINASYTYLSRTVPAGYFDLPQVVYTGSETEKLNKIGFQKWISLFFHGMEAWYDWRRTGIPALVAGPSNQNNNMIPVRFRYPIIEQSLNAAGYNEAVARQGADDLNSKMWYLK